MTVMRVRRGWDGSCGWNGFVGWVKDLMQEKSGERYAMIEVRPEGCVYGLRSDITLNGGCAK